MSDSKYSALVLDVQFERKQTVPTRLTPDPFRARNLGRELVIGQCPWLLHELWMAALDYLDWSEFYAMHLQRVGNFKSHRIVSTSIFGCTQGIQESKEDPVDIVSDDKHQYFIFPDGKAGSCLKDSAHSYARHSDCHVRRYMNLDTIVWAPNDAAFAYIPGYSREDDFPICFMFPFDPDKAVRTKLFKLTAKQQQDLIKSTVPSVSRLFLNTACDWNADGTMCAFSNGTVAAKSGDQMTVIECQNEEFGSIIFVAFSPTDPHMLCLQSEFQYSIYFALVRPETGFRALSKILISVFCGKLEWTLSGRWVHFVSHDHQVCAVSPHSSTPVYQGRFSFRMDTFDFPLLSNKKVDLNHSWEFYQTQLGYVKVKLDHQWKKCTIEVCASRDQPKIFEHTVEMSHLMTDRCSVTQCQWSHDCKRLYVLFNNRSHQENRSDFLLILDT